VNDSANDSASDSVNDNASDSVNETADLAPGKLGGRGWRDIFLYGLARLVLFIVLTVVIQLIAVLLGMGQSFPLAISALLALIIAFPLSMFVFKDLRLRVNEHLAVRDAGRRAHKDQMRAQLEERLD
jgi:Na+/melibiose symporter-like transporter